MRSLKSPQATKILVVGGGGYIGSWLVPLLIESGREVTVLGRSSRPKFVLPEGVRYISADFGHAETINALVSNHVELIHLAYATVPNTSFENPLGDLLENLPATLNLLSAASRHGCKLLFVSSGGTVYGESKRLPIREDHSTEPISPYGVTKLTLENYARLYAKTHDLNYVCVRPANAYGVGQRPYSGQGFISTAVASIFQKKGIKVFGEHGTIRDYIYVSDLAAGMVSVLENWRPSQTYNIGTGQGYSNIDVINAIALHMRRCFGEEISLPIEYCPERIFDVKVNILDSSKLTTDTGWQPKVTLPQGLHMTVDWITSNIRSLVL